jgi:hypothetical protein
VAYAWVRSIQEKPPYRLVESGPDGDGGGTLSFVRGRGLSTRREERKEGKKHQMPLLEADPCSFLDRCTWLQLLCLPRASLVTGGGSARLVTLNDSPTA